MERCGKINAVNSVAESWTGMGVVAGVCATVLMMQRPHVKHVDTHWRIKLLQILQEVRSICKTRNQLSRKVPVSRKLARTHLDKHGDHFFLLIVATTAVFVRR